MDENQISELALDITETYLGISLDDNFDPSTIDKDTFLAISYANMVNLDVAKPTPAGIEIMEKGKAKVFEILADLEDMEDMDDEY